MPISALVVTLDDEPEARERALRWLEADARLLLGEEVDGHLPVVLETATLRDGVSAVEALLSGDGIKFVDVVSVDFSDGEA